MRRIHAPLPVAEDMPLHGVLRIHRLRGRIGVPVFSGMETLDAFRHDTEIGDSVLVDIGKQEMSGPGTEASFLTHALFGNTKTRESALNS